MNIRKLLLDKLSDNELIDLCIENNAMAQKALYEKYAQKFITIAMRYFKNKEDAVSVTHDAFLKVFNKLESFNKEASLELWMKRILVHTAIDKWRAMHRSKRVFVSEKELEQYPHPQEESMDVISEQWNALCTIPADVLMHLISQLPPATSLIFNLYVIEQYSHQEIADN